MRFPSLAFLSQQTYQALARFPLSIFSAAIAVFFGIYLVEYENDITNEFPYINLLLCGYLGIPLFIALKAYTEAMKHSGKHLLFGRLIITLLLVMVYFYLPGSEETLNKSLPYIRYTIFATAAHLLVSFAPFLRQGTLNGFWNFNKALFLRFLLALLYSAVFYTGIVLAILAIKSLFNVEVQDELFFEIFIFIAGLFNTWFFVAGIPDEFPGLDEDKSYPRGLRTFILYVLIPLLTVYFIILYAYSLKIIFIWDWPRGIISYMIICVAVLGILSMLLAYPYSRTEDRSPLTFMSKGYYWVLLPMIVMLYLAIGIRVGDYGVTINRYLTILLAVWLTFVSGYLVFIGKNIRLIPISLFLVILLTSFGPWGIFKVSERSQIRRLRSVLEQANLLENKIINEPVWIQSDTLQLTLSKENVNEGLLTDSLHNEVMSILDYLEDFHGLNGITDWYAQDLKEIAKTTGVSEDVVAMRLMGLEYSYKHEGNREYYYLNNKKGFEEVVRVSGYDYLMDVSYSYYNYHTGNDSVQEKLLDQTGAILVLSNTSVVIRSDSLGSPLTLELLQRTQQLIAENAGSYSELPSEKMTLTGENDWCKATLRLTSVSVQNQRVESYSGMLLFTVKRPW